MKILRLLIAVILFASNNFIVAAQEFKLRTYVPGEKAENYNPKDDRKLKASPQYFLGKWIAENDDMAYELEFIKDTIRIDDMVANEYHFSEFILGKIIYRVNQKIVKETNCDGLNSVLYGTLSNLFNIHFNYRDRETMVWYGVEFAIDKDDPTKATWKFGIPRNDWDGKWNNSKPDIPMELSFRKID